jgi:hypothetical protein
VKEATMDSETHENPIEKCEEMARDFGSKFSPCPCGRKRVLMYRRAENWPKDFSSNGADSNRLTYHNTPEGIACEHGGKLLSEVKP